MKALLFDVNVPKFLIIQTLRLLSSRFCYEGPFATVKLGDIPEPELPSPEWVKIKTRLCGFCGSDIFSVCFNYLICTGNQSSGD